MDTAAVVTTLRAQVQSVDPALPIFRARTLPQVRLDIDWNGRVSNGLFLFLAFIAVAAMLFVRRGAPEGGREGATNHFSEGCGAGSS